MFQRAEGEELEEENVLEEEDDQAPDVPLSYVVENLTTMNYSFEDMIKIILNDFLDSDQDERSLSILEAIDDLVDRYEGTTADADFDAFATATATATATVGAPVTNTLVAPVAASNTDDEDSDDEDSDDEDSDDEEEASEKIKTFAPKINFNVVKRYQATSYLCGNN